MALTLLYVASLHYAASASHPWGLPASDPFNGFALRGALHKSLSEYVARPQEDKSSKVLFDDIVNPTDDAIDLRALHEHMSSSVFCAMPAGDSPTRRAIYEALQLGCIPVIFREHSYGRLLPSSPEINDMSKYTVLVEETDLINGVGLSLVERLEQITPREIHRMQRHIRDIASKLQWSIPDDEYWFPPSRHSVLPPIESSLPTYNRTLSCIRQSKQEPTTDAFAMLLKELDAIKKGEWVAGVARDKRKGVTAQPFGRKKRPLRSAS